MRARHPVRARAAAVLPGTVRTAPAASGVDLRFIRALHDRSPRITERAQVTYDPGIEVIAWFTVGGYSHLGIGALAARVAWPQDAAGRTPRIGLLISETLADQASRIDALRAGLQRVWLRRRPHDHHPVALGRGQLRPPPRAGCGARRAQGRRAGRVRHQGARGGKQRHDDDPHRDPGDEQRSGRDGHREERRPPGHQRHGRDDVRPGDHGEAAGTAQGATPGATRVGILVNPANASFAPTLQQMSPVAKSARSSR